jgi:uncharacterized protein (TIGR00159 family)
MDFALHIGFLEVTITDIIDILLVSYLLYQLYKIVRGNVAFRIALGVLAIYLTYMVVRALKMELLSAILGQFIGVGVLAAIILFQPEIRKFLQVLGKNAFANQDSFILSLFRKKTNPHDIDIKEVIEAAKSLSGTNTGALIAFTRNTDLKTYVESGDKLEAAISRRLLLSIFQKHSPLHDGAVIIRENKIAAARCILPVSDDASIPAHMGLRHRSAIGLTEITDAIVLTISEETSQISLAYDGKIDTNLSPAEIKQKLTNLLNLQSPLPVLVKQMEVV